MILCSMYIIMVPDVCIFFLILFFDWQLNTFHGPFGILRTLKHSSSLLGQVWLASVSDDVLKVDGLPGFLVLFSLAGFFALLFFEVDFDFGGFGVLFGEDGFGDAAPEGEGFVGELLVFGGNDFGGDVEGGDVYDGVLVFGGDGFLGKCEF